MTTLLGTLPDSDTQESETEGSKYANDQHAVAPLWGHLSGRKAWGKVSGTRAGLLEVTREGWEVTKVILDKRNGRSEDHKV